MTKVEIGNFIIFCCFLNFCSCKTVKLKDNLKLMDNSTYLYVGSGGGFTGQMVDYYFLENGYILKTNSLKKETIQLDQKLDQKQFQQLKNQLKSRITKNMGSTSNVSSYVGIKINGETKRAIWKKGEIENTEIQTIYKILMNSVKE